MSASRELALYVGLNDSPAIVLRKFRAAQSAARASEHRIAVLAERLRKGSVTFPEALRRLRRAT